MKDRLVNGSAKADAIDLADKDRFDMAVQVTAFYLRESALSARDNVAYVDAINL